MTESANPFFFDSKFIHVSTHEPDASFLQAHEKFHEDALKNSSAEKNDEMYNLLTDLKIIQILREKGVLLPQDYSGSVSDQDILTGLAKLEVSDIIFNHIEKIDFAGTEVIHLHLPKQQVDKKDFVKNPSYTETRSIYYEKFCSRLCRKILKSQKGI